MSRRLGGLATLSAVVVAVVLAIAWPGGSGGQESYGQVPDGPWAYIDKNINNGDGACDPEYIDDETTEVVGSKHQLAVCIGGLSQQPVGGFELGIRYDDVLDECEDVPCDDDDCLDDNPDANAGVTTWGSSLGEGWDCDIEGEPICDDDDGTGPQRGLALIWCEGPYEGGSFTLGDDESWGALAVLNLNVAAAGTDVVAIDYLIVGMAPNGGLIGACFVDGVNGEAALVENGMLCQGATDTKVPPTPTEPPRRDPTDTPTPTVTPTQVPPSPTSPPPADTPLPTPSPAPTLFGGPGGIIVPPPTGSGPSGGGFSWALMASLLAGNALAAGAAGGFYLRFAKGSRRDSS